MPARGGSIGINIPVDLKLQINQMENYVKVIQDALGKIKPDTKSYRDLNNIVGKITKGLNSLAVESNKTFSTGSQFNHFRNNLENIGSLTSVFIQRLNEIKVTDLDIDTSEYEEKLNKLQTLTTEKNSIVAKQLKGLFNNVDFKKITDELQMALTDKTTFEGLTNSFDSVIKKIKTSLESAKREALELQKTLNKQDEKIASGNLREEISFRYRENSSLSSNRQKELIKELKGQSELFQSLNFNASSEKVPVMNFIENIREQLTSQLAAYQKTVEEEKSKILKQKSDLEKALTELSNLKGWSKGDQGKQQKQTISNLLGEDFIQKNGQTLPKVREAIQGMLNSLNVEDISFDSAREIADKWLEQVASSFQLSGSQTTGVKNSVERFLKDIGVSFESSELMPKIGETENSYVDRVLQSLITKRNEIQKTYDELGVTIQQGEQKIESINAAKSQVSTAEELSGQQFQKLAQEIAALKIQLDELQKKYESFKEEIVEGVEVSSAKDLKNLLSATGQRINDLEKQKNSLDEAFSRTDNIKQYFTYWLSMSSIMNKVSSVIRNAANEIKELDTVITEIAIVTDMSQEELWDQIGTYSDIARQYGVSTRGAYEVSQLFYQQGLQTAEVMQLTGETLKLARIANLDYATATDYMTVAIRGFKLEMSEAQHVTDVYAALAAATASSVEELAVAMSKTASSMEAVGASFESTSAMIATMVSVTRESPQNIGSALKSIVSRYGEMTADPTKLVDSEGEEMSLNRVDKALKSIGISLQDTAGQFRDFDDVILELAEKWDTLDTNSQRYIATIMAGNRQQSRFLALVGNYEEYSKALEVAADSAEAGTLQHLKTLDSIPAKLQQAKTAWEEFYNSMGLEDTAKKVLDIFSTILTNLSSMGKWSAFSSILNILTGAKKGINVLFSLFKSGASRLFGNVTKELKELTGLRDYLAKTVEINVDTTKANQQIDELLQKKVALGGKTYGQVLSEVGIIPSTTMPGMAGNYNPSDSAKIMADGLAKAFEEDRKKGTDNLLRHVRNGQIDSSILGTAGKALYGDAWKDTADQQAETKKILAELNGHLGSFSKLTKSAGIEIEKTSRNFLPRLQESLKENTALWIGVGDAVQAFGSALTAWALTIEDKSTDEKETSKIRAGQGQLLSGVANTVTGTIGLGSILSKFGWKGWLAAAAISFGKNLLTSFIPGLKNWFDGADHTLAERLEKSNNELNELQNEASLKKGEYNSLKNVIDEINELSAAQYNSAEDMEAYKVKLMEVGEEYPHLINALGESSQIILDVEAAERQLIAARKEAADAARSAAQEAYRNKLLNFLSEESTYQEMGYSNLAFGESLYKQVINTKPNSKTEYIAREGDEKMLQALAQSAAYGEDFYEGVIEALTSQDVRDSSHFTIKDWMQAAVIFGVTPKDSDENGSISAQEYRDSLYKWANDTVIKRKDSDDITPAGMIAWMVDHAKSGNLATDLIGTGTSTSGRFFHYSLDDIKNNDTLFSGFIAAFLNQGYNEEYLKIHFDENTLGQLKQLDGKIESGEAIAWSDYDEGFREKLFNYSIGESFYLNLQRENSIKELNALEKEARFAQIESALYNNTAFYWGENRDKFNEASSVIKNLVYSDYIRSSAYTNAPAGTYLMEEGSATNAAFEEAQANILKFLENPENIVALDALLAFDKQISFFEGEQDLKNWIEKTPELADIRESLIATYQDYISATASRAASYFEQTSDMRKNNFGKYFDGNLDNTEIALTYFDTFRSWIGEADSLTEQGLKKRADTLEGSIYNILSEFANVPTEYSSDINNIIKQIQITDEDSLNSAIDSLQSYQQTEGIHDLDGLIQELENARNTLYKNATTEIQLLRDEIASAAGNFEKNISGVVEGFSYTESLEDFKNIAFEGEEFSTIYNYDAALNKWVYTQDGIQQALEQQVNDLNERIISAGTSITKYQDFLNNFGKGDYIKQEEGYISVDAQNIYEEYLASLTEEERATRNTSEYFKEWLSAQAKAYGEEYSIALSELNSLPLFLLSNLSIDDILSGDKRVQEIIAIAKTLVPEGETELAENLDILLKAEVNSGIQAVLNAFGVIFGQDFKIDKQEEIKNTYLEDLKALLIDEATEVSEVSKTLFKQDPSKDKVDVLKNALEDLGYNADELVVEVSSDLDEKLSKELQLKNLRKSQLDNLLSRKIGEKINISAIQDLLGGKGYHVDSDGFATLTGAEDVLGLLREIGPEGAAELGMTMGEVQETIQEVLTSWADALKDGISGDLSYEDFEILSAQFGISAGQTFQTANGLQLTQAAVFSVYERLKAMDGMTAQLTLKEMADSARDADKELNDVFKVQKKINKLQAENNKEQKTQLELLQRIQRDIISEGNAFNFMNAEIPTEITNPLSAWEGMSQALQVLQGEDFKAGRISYENFRAMMQMIDSSDLTVGGLSASQLMEQAWGALKFDETNGTFIDLTDLTISAEDIMLGLVEAMRGVAEVQARITEERAAFSARVEAGEFVAGKWLDEKGMDPAQMQNAQDFYDTLSKIAGVEASFESFQAIEGWGKRLNDIYQAFLINEEEGIERLISTVAEMEAMGEDKVFASAEDRIAESVKNIEGALTGETLLEGASEALNQLNEIQQKLEELQSQGYTIDLIYNISSQQATQDGTYSVTIEDNGTAETLSNLANALLILEQKAGHLAGALEDVPDKSVEVQQTANAINSLQSRIITARINVSVNDVGSAFVSSASFGLSSTQAVAMAKGTLMGELGPELVSANGHYFTVGNNGAEFVNLPSDAIVFNHLQTRKLLGSGSISSTGKPVTNERKAVAHAKGTAMASANVHKETAAIWDRLFDYLGDWGWSDSGAGTGGGAGGDSESTAAYIHDLERWYNLLRQIEKLEQQINLRQQERENFVSGYDYVNSLEKELNLLQKQQKVYTQLASLQKDFYDRRREDLLASDYSKIFTYDEDGLMQYVDGKGRGLDVLATLNQTDAYGAPLLTSKQQVEYLKENGFDINKFLTKEDGTKIKSSDYAAILEVFWSGIDSWMDELDTLYDDYNDHIISIEETLSAQNEILQEYIDNQRAVEDKLFQAIEDREQAEIDRFQKNLDATQEATSKYLEGLNRALDKEREMYNRNEEDAETTRLQRQLSILQRSGGSASEIKSLQDQINSRLQDSYFSEQERQIQAVQEASDLQLEKMQQQLDVMNETLEYQKENGLLWQEVSDMMMSWTPEAMMDFIERFTKTYREDSLLENEEKTKETLKELEIWDAKQRENGRGSLWETYLEGAKTRYDEKVIEDNELNAKEAYLSALRDNKTEAEASAAADEIFNNVKKPQDTNAGSSGEQSGDKETTGSPEKKSYYIATYSSLSGSGQTIGYFTENEARKAAIAAIDAAADAYFKSHPERRGSSDLGRTIDQMKKSIIIKKYAKGGLVDFTGPAWVDGTKSKPEAFLSAEDTALLKSKIFSNSNYSLKSIIEMLESLGRSFSSIDNSSNNREVVFENVEVNIASNAIASDYDARRAGEQVLEELMSIARRNSNIGVARR